ncbi:DUF6165 family protein [Tateyamaria sp. syn59]|uniref:DUF6165 family protein n=1 Tax=Tateyamaria sp. syn59 TaxID=2576942 RepID=UPI0011BDB528|nr:DUF6165 family protein [Tateyamaria sp. syn59]
MSDLPSSIKVSVSFGELFDKIAILEIKSERIQETSKRNNSAHELAALRRSRDEIFQQEEIKLIDSLLRDLKSVNENLWEIEDRIREHEAAHDFGADFIKLARSVYQMNDERYRLKREINLALGSPLIEEKSYC